MHKPLPQQTATLPSARCWELPLLPDVPFIVWAREWPKWLQLRLPDVGIRSLEKMSITSTAGMPD